MMAASVPPSDLGTVQALLKIISDPKAAQGWLDKIAGAKDESQSILDKANAANADADVKLAKAKELAEQAENVSRNAIAMREEALAKKRDYDERLYTLETAEKALNQRTGDANNALMAREKAVAARESEIDERERKAESMWNQAKNMASVYEGKLSELKKLTE